VHQAARRGEWALYDGTTDQPMLPGVAVHRNTRTSTTTTTTATRKKTNESIGYWRLQWEREEAAALQIQQRVAVAVAVAVAVVASSRSTARGPGGAGEARDTRHAASSRGAESCSNAGRTRCTVCDRTHTRTHAHREG